MNLLDQCNKVIFCEDYFLFEVEMFHTKLSILGSIEFCDICNIYTKLLWQIFKLLGYICDIERFSLYSWLAYLKS